MWTLPLPLCIRIPICVEQRARIELKAGSLQLEEFEAENLANNAATACHLQLVTEGALSPPSTRTFLPNLSCNFCHNFPMSGQVWSSHSCSRKAIFVVIVAVIFNQPTKGFDLLFWLIGYCEGPGVCANSKKVIKPYEHAAQVCLVSFSLSSFLGVPSLQLFLLKCPRVTRVSKKIVWSRYTSGSFLPVATFTSGKLNITKEMSLS